MDPNALPHSHPAALLQISTELTAQASQLTLHQQQLTRLSTLTEELVRALQGLNVSSPEAAAQQVPIRSSFPPAQTPPISPRLAFPEKFDGEPARCKGFLLQCLLFINQQLAVPHRLKPHCFCLLVTYREGTGVDHHCLEDGRFIISHLQYIPPTFPGDPSVRSPLL